MRLENEEEPVLQGSGCPRPGSAGRRELAHLWPEPQGPCEGEVGQDRGSGDAGPQSPGEPTGSYPLDGELGKGFRQARDLVHVLEKRPVEWWLGGGRRLIERWWSGWRSWLGWQWRAL